jgi:micrococcal nuclease
MIRIMLLMALALINAASAGPNEASGIVTRVIDGNTFEVQGFGPVSLADIRSPEMSCMDGVHAREYALENLLGVEVFLDIDGRWGHSAKGAVPCVIYLANPNGTPNFNKNFNKMMVQGGFATIKNDTGNEFDPTKW